MLLENSELDWTRCGLGGVVRVNLEVNRLLGLRAPTNEIAHRVASSLKINRITCSQPSCWRASFAAHDPPFGLAELNFLHADCTTDSGLIARLTFAPSGPACTSASWLRYKSSTKRRMADDRLPCRRSESIASTSSDNVMFRSRAISFNPFQNASSRLTLVLWSATTTERLTTRDFMTPPPAVVNS